MSYQQEVVTMDEFQRIIEDKSFTSCEWVVTNITMTKAGPKAPMRLLAKISAFPYTEDSEGVRAYGPSVKKVSLLEVADLQAAFPDLYATVGTAIYVEGQATADSPFKDAPQG